MLPRQYIYNLIYIQYIIFHVYIYMCLYLYIVALSTNVTPQTFQVLLMNARLNLSRRKGSEAELGYGLSTQGWLHPRKHLNPHEAVEPRGTVELAFLVFVRSDL